MEQGPARACWMINACCVVQRRLVQTSLGSPVMTVSSARGGVAQQNRQEGRFGFVHAGIAYTWRPRLAIGAYYLTAFCAVGSARQGARSPISAYWLI